MRARLLLVASLLAVLVLPPSGPAAPAAAELRVLPPLELTGDVDLATREGLLLLPPIRALEGRAERVNITLFRIAAAGPGASRPMPLAGQDPVPAGVPVLDREPAAPEVRYLEMSEPTGLVVASREAGARLVLAVGPYDEGRLALEGSAARLLDGAGAGAGDLPSAFAREAPWVAAEGAGTARASGTVRALVEGASLILQNATAALQVDATRGRDGARWQAVLRWTDASLETPVRAPARLVAHTLAMRVDGVLEAPLAWGSVGLDGAPGGARGEPVRAEGVLQGEVAPGGGHVRLRAQGDLAALAIGEQRQDFAKAAAAGAGLAVASALLWRFLGVPLYARIGPSELLDNEVRRRVHAHLQASPGADVKDTAAAVGVSWSTAAYHLARLEREGVVLSRRAGRSRRFFVNGGASAGRAEAIGFLRNPTALGIAHLVARRPGLMQKEIGAALGLPASTVSWHMRRLKALGVVEEARKWRRAEYAPGPRWAEVAPAVGVLAPVAPAPPSSALPSAGPGAQPAS